MWSIYHPRRSEPPECRMVSGRVVLQILGSFQRVRLLLIDLLQFVLMMSCYSFFFFSPPSLLKFTHICLILCKEELCNAVHTRLRDISVPLD